jgi:apolipoprotein D and lipocalin family protein
MACAQKTADFSGTYRQNSAQIYSNATLDETRLIGDWTQVGSFGAPGCAPGSAEFSGGPGALRISYDLCLSGARSAAQGSLPRSGPGRYAAPGLPGELWLLWVDTDARTLVFGTPSGAFGFVLNRGGALPSDRAGALREILDWNGYDTAKLTLW